MFSSHQGGSTSGITLLFVVFLISMTLGTILMCFLNKRDGKMEEVQESSMMSLLKSVIAPLYDLWLLLIIPLIAYSGLQQAFVWAEYTKFIVHSTCAWRGWCRWFNASYGAI